MASNSENLTSEIQINNLIVSFIGENHILLDKSQVPEAKNKKILAIKELCQILQINAGKILEEKQVIKRIANMKAIVKQKTDSNQTGNKQVKLNNWENKFFEVMSGKVNPTVTKMGCSVSAGLKRSFVCDSDDVVLKESPSRQSAPKRVILQGETAETVNLSNTDLQRLVLLEQLRYTREKRLFHQERSAQARVAEIRPVNSEMWTEEENCFVYNKL
jgi:hypothetical protein